MPEFHLRPRTGIASAAMAALTAILAAPSLAHAQFPPPSGGASAATAEPVLPAAPDPGTAERQVGRQRIVGERSDSVLRPADISRMRDLMLDAQGAAVYPAYSGQSLPTPRRLNIAYAPDPDRGPEALHLWRGMATSVTFLDPLGKPVPIESVVYDQKSFSMNGKGCMEDGGNGAQPAGDDKDDKDKKPTSTFFMVPCKHWTWGSFLVQLQGQSIPVTFMATSGELPADGGKPVLDMPVVVTVAKPPAATPSTPVTRKVARHATGQEASK